MKQDTNYVVPRYSKLKNKFMRAGSIMSMCISAILDQCQLVLQGWHGRPGIMATFEL